MAQGICKLLWLKIILKDLEIKIKESMMSYWDNKATINIVNSPIHDQTKHVEVDLHFIKEKLDSGEICTPYISSTGKLADILTKALPNIGFHQILDKLGMQDIFAPT